MLEKVMENTTDTHELPFKLSITDGWNNNAKNVW